MEAAVIADPAVVVEAKAARANPARANPARVSQARVSQARVSQAAADQAAAEQAGTRIRVVIGSGSSGLRKLERGFLALHSLISGSFIGGE